MQAVVDYGNAEVSTSAARTSYGSGGRALALALARSCWHFPAVASGWDRHEAGHAGGFSDSMNSSKLFGTAVACSQTICHWPRRSS
jgi:hypothetical protein